MNTELSTMTDSLNEVLDRIQEAMRRRREQLGDNTIEFSGKNSWQAYFEYKQFFYEFMRFRMEMEKYFDFLGSQTVSRTAALNAMLKELSGYSFRFRDEIMPCVCRRLEYVQSRLVELVRQGDFELLNNGDLRDLGMPI